MYQLMDLAPILLVQRVTVPTRRTLPYHLSLYLRYLPLIQVSAPLILIAYFPLLFHAAVIQLSV